MAKPKADSPKLFGQLVPFGDPTWYQGWHSPYYNESHDKLREYTRSWVDQHITPNCHDWDEQKEIPRELFREWAKAGFANMVCGPIVKSDELSYDFPVGLTPTTFDPFHELVVVDEFSRPGSAGVLWSLFEGLSIGLPPIILFGSQALKDRVAKPCLAGEKVICLGITEPTAGSDVAAISTTATLTPDGKHYIVNGVKKWITNGVFADFFTVAVRTGDAKSGLGGISLLLLERGMEGLVTRQMKCQGVWPSGTTLINFDNVKVPVENLIGELNQGFKYIMYNFNHERFGLCVQSLRFARVCLEEAMLHAQRRKTFGKFLIDHPVIRNKLAHMARHLEASQALLESIAYQQKMMTKQDMNTKLGGAIAILKLQSTITYELCAREAAQILGGIAYTRGGLGEKVERLYREVRCYAIGGGSEEIMADMGIRQSLKVAADLKAKNKPKAKL